MIKNRQHIPSTCRVASVETSPHTHVYLAASLIVTSVNRSCWMNPSDEICTLSPGCSSSPSLSQVQKTSCLSSWQVRVTVSPSLAFVSSKGLVNLAGFSTGQQGITHTLILYSYMGLVSKQSWNLLFRKKTLRFSEIWFVTMKILNIFCNIRNKLHNEFFENPHLSLIPL